MNKTYGKTIRDIRKTKNMSKPELAKKVSLDFSYISKLENDRIPPPAADTIVKICNVLEVAPDELLALTGKMPSDVKEIFSANPAAMQFLRTAKALRLTEDEWGKLTKQIKRLRG